MREIPEINESSLFKLSVSGMGTSFGLASMFVLFHDKLSFFKNWLSIIDLSLAFCVVLFSVRSIIELNKFMGKLKNFSEDQLQNHTLQKYPGIYPPTMFNKAFSLVFLIMTLCFAAWLLTITSPPLISAVVVAFIIIAIIIEFLLATIIRLIAK